MSNLARYKTLVPMLKTIKMINGLIIGELL